MDNRALSIATQINELLNELVELAGGGDREKMAVGAKGKTKPLGSTKGASGGLRLLIEEGFFDSPRQLSEVITKLRQDGRHYPKPTVSMGLLALVRSRYLVRIQEKDSKNWKYVIRR